MSNPNLKGNKNSGRKTTREEVAAVLNMGLANSIMNEELAKIKDKKNRKHEEIKDFVQPFALKGIVTKSQSDVTLKTPIPLDSMADILNIDTTKAN